MTSRTNQKGVCKFIGLVNYYCDMESKILHMLQPLTNFTPSSMEFKWIDIKHRLFNKIIRLCPVIFY